MPPRHGSAAARGSSPEPGHHHIGRRERAHGHLRRADAARDDEVQPAHPVRVRALCQLLTERYDGEAANVWAGVDSGAELSRRLQQLPGFGAEKAAIFVALLGKQRGVTPPGWQEAAGAFGEAGVFRSVADIVDADSLARVRDTKKSVKAARRAAASDA